MSEQYDFIIEIVEDQACPECGAYWGHPDPKLNYPNRIKVDMDWKCYNPNCKVDFYCDGEVICHKLSPNEEAKLTERVAADVAAMMDGKEFYEVRPNVWALRDKS